VAIFRFSNAGGFGTYQRYNDFLAGNPTTPVITDFGSMFPLGVFTLSSAQASVTFTNIPQTYKHLQIRWVAKNTAGNNGIYGQIRFGNNTVDTGSNYSFHAVAGQGVNTYAIASASQNIMRLFGAAAGTNNNDYPDSGYADVLDYANTNKNTTMRSLNGADANGSGEIRLHSGLWMSTAAVNIITIYAFSQGVASNFGQNSIFALYGIQGA
jgi:hypothetical protein